MGCKARAEQGTCASHISPQRTRLRKFVIVYTITRNKFVRKTRVNWRVEKIEVRTVGRLAQNDLQLTKIER